jgi:folylpolyglutamate synthase/dihydropteroate synthase
MGLPVEVAGSVAEGVRVALERADPEDIVLVTGSLYAVGAARSVLVHESDR